MTKFYVNDANQATIICPKCGFVKTIDTTNFKETKRRLKAKCRCGEVFKFMLEFRKNYRKDVRLPGEYTIQQSGIKGEIIVKNLSTSGIHFTSLRAHQISTADTLNLKFNLDNSVRKEIRKLAKVIWVRDHDVGAHYIGPESFRKDLSFYLRS